MEISSLIIKAKKWLDQNEVIAIPTETVYGLAASIYSKKAIESIYSIKNRPSTNPLIVHIKSERELYKYAQNLPIKAKILAKTFWPGPLTLVLPKTDLIPNYITANNDTVAIRVPNHSLTLELLSDLEYPLAAPSANPSNRISSTTTKHVEKYFKGVLPFVLDGGDCSKGLESTIVGFENGEPIIYRLGALTIEHIELVVGKVQVKSTLKDSEIPMSPGMFNKHYAPKTPFYVVDEVMEFLETTTAKTIVYIGHQLNIEHRKIKHQFLLSENGNMEEMASNLYKILLKADALESDVIVTTWFENKNLGMSINDRLKRASAK
ncbi:L-threonylcarbamoyladenylate synthase [Flavobacterium sp.]|jgi:L-threonylcarbamoyladenylate synthase|uniref:L-threonylcarbamoyladenylate synthase n=1 Tax=Flavobacterium sp. TaxID=239 RepID=UPI002A8247BC|nr:L-threonylcarbamoyladenylate synthase [Flavobacterium sp.]